MEAREIQTRDLVLRSERDGATHTLYLSGEFDLAAGESFVAELQRIEASDAGVIVISLEDLTFMDSTGIRLLLEAEMRSRLDSNRLRLLRPKGAQVRRALEITNVHDRLSFVD